jgi:predicted nucleic acid-binding protein
MSVLLDTSILVDLLRGKPAALAFVGGLAKPPSLSVVTVAELRAGQRSAREAVTIDQLVGSYAIHDASLAVAERAGAYLRQYRKSHQLDMADILIAATAAHHGLALATLNLKHFPMFTHLTAPY